MYYLLKWIKFSVKKIKHLKILENGKNTGKVRESLGILGYVGTMCERACDSIRA